jgi:hypothetical protein
MIAVQWPNKLGWDVGSAEVRDCVTRLRVFAPLPEKYGRERYTRLDVPVGVSPVAAVVACRTVGDVIYCDHPCETRPWRPL